MSFRCARFRASGAALIAGIALSPPLRAEALGTAIEIERAPGSEACPDQAAVFRAIARLFPERAIQPSRDAEHSAASARVEIHPRAGGHEAVVTVTLPRPGQRVIREARSSCDGLADALAVAITLLVDPSESAADTSESPDPTAPVAPPSSDSPEPVAAEPEPEPRPAAPAGASSLRSLGAPSQRKPSGLQMHAGVLAVGGVGLLAEPAAGAAIGLDVFHRAGIGLTFRGLRLWSPPADAAGGSVTLSLWALLGGVCYRYRARPFSSIDACGSLAGGSQYAEVKGFNQPRSGDFPWLSLVPALRYHHQLGELFEASVGLGAVWQLRRQSFSVAANDANGSTTPVARAPALGLLAELGLSFGGSVF